MAPVPHSGTDEEDDDFIYDDDDTYDDEDFDDAEDVFMNEDAPAEEVYSETSENPDVGVANMDDEDDGYDAFDVTAGETKPEKKPYEITYKVKSVADLQAEQRDLVNRVAGLVDCDPSTAATLLRHYHWNSEKLTEVFWEDPARALDAAGLSPPSSPSSSSKPLPSTSRPNTRRTGSQTGAKSTASSSTKASRSRTTTESFECPICCTDFEPSGLDSQTLCMSCDHRFCKGCWAEYLNQKIMQEAEAGGVQCMQQGCGRIVTEKVVESLIEGRVRERYRELLDRTYVDDSSNIKWCPHPDCEYAVYTSQAPSRLLTQVIPTVECGCGRAWCFGCGEAYDHRPLICKFVRLWKKKCEDDSETSNWLMANTKECAKCASTIEKNGGCNHMTCKKCKYEFCWVCLADWSSHGTSWYNCNRYDDRAGVQARDAQAKSRASLERYLHYFNRFANHEQSAKLDKQLYQKTEKKMEEMQARTNLTWIEVQFAKKAVDVLLDARMTLKWTYAMAYYLKKCNSTTIFEDNQANLEQAVEDLSEMLEKPIEPENIPQIRADMTNKTAYVQKRSDIILNDTLLGHWEHRWEWNQ